MKRPPLLSPESAGVLRAGTEMPPTCDAPGMQTVIQTPSLRVLRWTFARGQGLAPHSTSRQAVVQILSGSCEFSLGELVSPLVAGDLVWMPPGQTHAVRALEECSMLLTLVDGVPGESPSAGTGEAIGFVQGGPRAAILRGSDAGASGAGPETGC
ncbi:MAG: cupin domain-containing protein [Verrucomicrobiales bacterium]|nr:cupin domain-containing protein [Verrucomicrobiales bacterium]